MDATPAGNETRRLLTPQGGRMDAALTPAAAGDRRLLMPEGAAWARR
ncbi:hypothetical protein ACQP2P_03690 [Dactylosporangium sp. CA-139114]